MDASWLAFGTCAYVRWGAYGRNSWCKFVAAKTRVAPLKELTIPRQELEAAVLASRLVKTIWDETRQKLERCHRLVIAWIQGKPRNYKAFVSCRVSEIQTNSNHADWYHCPTSMNVADDLTKGISAKDANGRLFNGPDF